MEKIKARLNEIEEKMSENLRLMMQCRKDFDPITRCYDQTTWYELDTENYYLRLEREELEKKLATA